MSRAVLLVNLGSPDSPSVPDVRRYLREFLSDPFVLDGSWLMRQLVLNLFILPTRPKNTSHAYQQIWQKEGSPLIITSRHVQSLLQQKTNLPVDLAMRYGKPSIPDVLQQMMDRGVKEIFLVPLYPHYALSSTETAVAKVKEVLKKNPDVVLKVLPSFYKDPNYIRALVQNSSEALSKNYDHLLFSFHGLPERHLRLADPSKNHCLIQKECCQGDHPAHQTCYRAQAFRTVQEFVKLAKIPEGKYSVAFQSRLGSDPWLKPYTDLEIEAFPSRGIKRLLVISPAFVADCLETLEELGVRGREIFMNAGGSEYHLIPCLNEHPLWIEALEKFIQRYEGAAEKL